MGAGRTRSLAFCATNSHCVVGGETYARVHTWQHDSKPPTFVTHMERLSHMDAITAVAFGGDNLVVTGGRDHTVQVWNVDSPRPSGVSWNERKTPLAVLPHLDQVSGLLVSKDGETLVTIQRDGLVRVWGLPDFKTRSYSVPVPSGSTIAKMVDRERWLIAGATHRQSDTLNASLRRTTDGIVLAETSMRGLFERGHLLDSAVALKTNILVTLHGLPRREFDADSNEPRFNGKLQLWTLPDCRPLGSQLKLNTLGEPRSVAIHPDGKTTAVVTAKMEVILIDIEQSPTVSATLLPRHIKDHVPTTPDQLMNGQITFSVDGNYVVTWGSGKGFNVWDIHARQPKFSTDFAQAWTIRHLDVAAKGNMLALAVDEHNEIVIIDGECGECIHRITHPAAVESVQFSPDGKAILTACADGRARVFRTDSGTRNQADLVHAKGVVDAVYSPDGLMLATLCSDSNVRIWNAVDGTLALKPIAVISGSRKLVYGADTRFLVVMGTATQLQTLDLSSFYDLAGIDDEALERFSKLGELLSGKFVEDGGTVDLTSEEWLDRWNQYRSSTHAP